MNTCEHYETLVSTWLDGQLERPEQIECLDHLARCVSCRDFYLDARELEGLVATVRTPAEAPSPSPEVWRRIEWVTRGERERPRRRRVPAWVLQAAAVLVVGVGLSVAVWNGGVATAPKQAEVLLGQSDSMTEERFLELTKEVMGADRRYHAAMYEIMGQVVRDTAATAETSPEDVLQWTEGGDDGEASERAARIPA